MSQKHLSRNNISRYYRSFQGTHQLPIIQRITERLHGEWGAFLRPELCRTDPRANAASKWMFTYSVLHKRVQKSFKVRTLNGKLDSLLLPIIQRIAEKVLHGPVGGLLIDGRVHSSLRKVLLNGCIATKHNTHIHTKALVCLLNNIYFVELKKDDRAHVCCPFFNLLHHFAHRKTEISDRWLIELQSYTQGWCSKSCVKMLQLVDYLAILSRRAAGGCWRYLWSRNFYVSGSFAVSMTPKPPASQTIMLSRKLKQIKAISRELVRTCEPLQHVTPRTERAKRATHHIGENVLLFVMTSPWVHYIAVMACLFRNFSGSHTTAIL